MERIIWRSFDDVPQEAWTRLDRRHPPSPFCTRSFLQIWCKHFGFAGCAQVVSLEQGGDILALLCLSARLLGPCLRVRESLGTSAVAGGHKRLIDRVEPAGVRAHAARLPILVRAAVLDLRPDEMLLLRSVPSDLPLEAIRSEVASLGRAMAVRPASISPYVELSSSWDEHFSSWSSSRQRDHRAAQRKLACAGQIRTDFHFGNIVPAEVLEAVATIDEKSWKAREGTNSFVPGLRLFFEDLMRVLVPLGEASVTVTWVDDRPAAFEISLWGRDTVYPYVRSYDERYRRFGLGNGTLERLMREAIARGRRRLDLLNGCEPYKVRIATGYRTELDLRVLPQ